MGDGLARIRTLDGGEEAEELLPRTADPDRALRNLVRFADAAGVLPAPLSDALALFAGSQSMSEAVIRDPALLAEALGGGDAPGIGELARRVSRELEERPGDPLLALRRFVRRETLRVLVEDLTGRIDLETTAARVSWIAEAAVDAALGLALEEGRAAHGEPRGADGATATITAIAFGKLGGGELNYSSDIDLVFLYSADGETDGARPVSNRRFFSEAVKRTRQLLAEATPEGHCYRVDLRLRPEGSTGALTRAVANAVEYYHRTARTWERQALIKARPVAGDRTLGQDAFVAALAAHVYETPLTMEGIRTIKQLKAEIERRNRDPRQVKSGRGGIRDVEFTVQFLQLLNGRAFPEVRRTGTLPALRALERVAALTAEEARSLAEAYAFLRAVEHRLQTMHEVRTHVLPADAEGLRLVALRLGLGTEDADPLEEFRAAHARHTAAARGVLERLFHNLFLEQSPEGALPTDFVLDPAEHREALRDWLGRRGFPDPAQAVDILTRLASSPHPRAREFLASLAPALLLRASRTPEPDRCLRNLERVVDALGAPAIFYQLLSGYPDILGVVTDLCGWSQHLTETLVRNPAMFDAFADALVVAPQAGEQPWDDLPLAEIVSTEDPSGLLHDLKDLSLLRIGVRDIQQKANTENTANDLTALAERILGLALTIAGNEVRAKSGPILAGTRLAVLGLGKLGAREMNYASDLDLVFVGEQEGAGDVLERLAQELLRLLTRPGPRGRLYEADARVRPHGRSGQLVVSPDEFERYYRDRARIAELQMLTKARTVCGDPDLCSRLEAVVAGILYGGPPRPGIRDEVGAMRERLERRARGRDLKRGFGGMVDIEFLVEALKLQSGHDHPGLRNTGTLAGLAASHREGLVPFRDYEALLTAMQFFRSVESRMRIVYDMARNRLPEDPGECDRLARRLGYVDTESTSAGAALLMEADHHTARTREIFLAFMAGE